MIMTRKRSLSTAMEAKKKEEETPTDLNKYRISPKTIEILNKQGITKLFPIQQETFDLIYDGKDIMGRDLTGSGKTLAYCLPLIERFRKEKVIDPANKRTDKAPLVIVVVPTRELAMQVTIVLEQLKHADEYKVQSVYGGSPMDPQVAGLRRGVEIVVGTTGRIMDLMERGTLKTSSLRCVVLDEADRMLDMGFQEDVERIYEYIRGRDEPKVAGAKAPAKALPQCCLFSATYPSWVKQVSAKYMKPDFKFVDLVKNLRNKTASSVKHLAVFSPYVNRTSILADIILCYGGTFGKTIVFCQTKNDANDLYLSEKLKGIEVLHGDIPQQQREITFRGFKEGRFHILVATDVASRGLDIPNVDLIVQCEPPKDVETYIHRSGRTARAGKEGTVVTFYAKKHAMMLSRIEKMAGITFTKIGAPQPEDIIKASSKFIVEGLKKVTDDALPLFEETADMLVKEFGERKSLLLTLSYISGNLNKIKKRSMLSGTEDYLTYQLETDNEFRTVSYVWGILRRLLPNDDAEEIRSMRCYNNYKGAAFDLPDKLCIKLDQAYKEEVARHRFMTYRVKRATELPDLKEFEPVGYSSDRRPYAFRDNGQSAPGATYYPATQSRSYGRGPPANGAQPEEGHFPARGRTPGPMANRDNDIFIWGIRTEEEIKDFLGGNKIGFQRIKLLKDEKGDSKMSAFVTVDKADVEQALKLTGMKVNRKAVRISLASDKPKGKF